MWRLSLGIGCGIGCGSVVLGLQVSWVIVPEKRLQDHKEVHSGIRAAGTSQASRRGCHVKGWENFL